MTVLSIDIGGTSFRVGAVQEDGSIAKFEKIPTKSVICSEDVLGDLTHYLKAFSDELTPDALAIGFPATLDRKRMRVVQAPNIPFMENIPVCEVLQKELSVPVLAERDATFALCYDAENYRLPTEGIVCGIYYGTGIGNAILIDGRPLTGRHGAAGELGHIPVFGSDIPCGCGNTGCMEAVAGGKALARMQKETFPDTPIDEMFIRHGKEKALIEFVDSMAIAAATEINILDPDHVILGGGVLNMKGFPIGSFEERIYCHTRKPLPWRELKLIYAEEKPEKSVIGGAIYARQRLWNNR